MQIIDVENSQSIQNAANVLKNGGVLIFPTDTVYGIGCLMTDFAIPKLYKIKNRPATQPTAVLMSRNVFDSKRIQELVLDKFDEEFMTGKVTVIDSISNYAIDFPKMIISADQKIGIRLPKYEWLEELIDVVGPIVASSANKRGEMPPAKFAEISTQLIKETDLIIKTDDDLPGIPSVVYDIEQDLAIRE